MYMDNQDQTFKSTVEAKRADRERIEAQTKVFLESGGKIKKLASIYTGYVPKPRAFTFSEKSGRTEQGRKQRIAHVKVIKKSTEEERSKFAREQYRILKEKNPKILKKTAIEIIGEILFENGYKVSEFEPYSSMTITRYLRHV